VIQGQERERYKFKKYTQKRLLQTCYVSKNFRS
jgi:hypothetical protein